MNKYMINIRLKNVLVTEYQLASRRTNQNSIKLRLRNYLIDLKAWVYYYNYIS